MRQETVALSQSELKKILVVERLLDGRMKNEEGALALGLSKRQIIRLKNRYRQNGAQSLAHGNRGKRSSRALPQEERDRIRSLYTRTYYGSNCCHFTDLLREDEGLALSVSSVRRILAEGGIPSPKVRGQQPRQHRPRDRRAEAGMLWQIDATPYPWLGEEYGSFALHAAIDDATGIVTGGVFRQNECMEGYFATMAQGIREYGIPLSLYSDKHTIFRSPNEKLSIEEELAGETAPLSQFGKAMSDLNIEHIKANTPQAKGRIERLWSTLQDRLVIELRLRGVTTMEAANDVLPAFLKKYSARFSVVPSSEKHAYRKLEDRTALEFVFSIRSMRKTGSGNSISYGGKTYIPVDPRSCLFTAKTTIEVRETMLGEVFIWHEGRAIATKIVEKPLKAHPIPHAQMADGGGKAHKPTPGHPWFSKNHRTRIALYEESVWNILNNSPHVNIHIPSDIFNDELG